MLSGSLEDKKIFYPFLLVDSFSRHWWIRIERGCVSVLYFSSTDREKNRGWKNLSAYHIFSEFFVGYVKQ